MLRMSASAQCFLLFVMIGRCGEMRSPCDHILNVCLSLVIHGSAVLSIQDLEIV